MLGLCSADAAGGGWRQNRLVGIVAGVGTLAALIAFSCRACRRASAPGVLPVAANVKGAMRWCLDCKKPFRVTTADLKEVVRKEPKYQSAPGAIQAKRVPCPHCGGTHTTEALQCEHCGRWFAPAVDPKGAGLCPHCKKRPYKR